MLTSTQMSESVICQVATSICSEMKDLSSDKHDSILRDKVEALKCFHWETIMCELEAKLTLMNLLKLIVPRAEQHRPLLSLIASQLLKSRHQRMGLAQCAVSVMLYGNGTSKQVITKCL